MSEANDLERATKMLMECDEVAHISTGSEDYTAFIPLRDDCTSELVVSSYCPLDAAQRAIQMYRLVKYGPEVVEASDWPELQDAMNKADQALSHFPTEDSDEQ